MRNLAPRGSVPRAVFGHLAQLQDTANLTLFTHRAAAARNTICKEASKKGYLHMNLDFRLPGLACWSIDKYKTKKKF